jgi:hypothetical protein
MSKFILSEFISKTFNMDNEITNTYKKTVLLHIEDDILIDDCILQEEKINV